MTVLYAVNIPEEPDAEPILYATKSKEHAESIVARLHDEISAHYPTFGDAMKEPIRVHEWAGSEADHAASLATNWWVHTSFGEC